VCQVSGRMPHPTWVSRPSRKIHLSDTFRPVGQGSERPAVWGEVASAGGLLGSGSSPGGYCGVDALGCGRRVPAKIPSSPANRVAIRRAGDRRAPRPHDWRCRPIAAGGRHWLCAITAAYGRRSPAPVDAPHSKTEYRTVGIRPTAGNMRRLLDMARLHRPTRLARVGGPANWLLNPLSRSE